MSAKTIFVIVLTVLITIIMMQNADEVKFKVLFWELYLPKLVIMTGVIFAGVIIGIMIGRPSRPSAKNFADENNNNQNTSYDTLSPEDRDYISD